MIGARNGIGGVDENLARERPHFRDHRLHCRIRESEDDDLRSLRGLGRRQRLGAGPPDEFAMLSGVAQAQEDGVPSAHPRGRQRCADVASTDDRDIHDASPPAPKT